MIYFIQVCCICEVSDSKFVDMTTTVNGDKKLIDKLKYCVPEIETLRVPCTSLICESCSEKLDVVFKFKQSCIKAHKNLNKYFNKLNIDQQNEISQLKVNLELGNKNKPVATPQSIVKNSSSEKLYTVYRVEVIKELNESEDTEFETKAVDFLREDLSSIAAEISSVTSSTHSSTENSESFRITSDDENERHENESVNLKNFSSTFSSEISVISPIICENNEYEPDPHIVLTDVEADKNLSLSESVMKCNESDIDVSTLQCVTNFNEFNESTFVSEPMVKYNESNDVIILETDTQQIQSAESAPVVLFASELKEPREIVRILQPGVEYEVFNENSEQEVHNFMGFTKDEIKYAKMMFSKARKRVTLFCSFPNFSGFKRAKAKLKKVFFHCKICNKNFTRSTNYKSHMLLHEKDAPYVCAICMKTFRHQASLKEHINVHLNLQKYCCKLCNQKFPTQGQLYYHRKVYHQQSSHTCQVCDRYFSCESTLKKHLRIHDPQCAFCCAVCKKGFKSNSNLKRHFAVHSNDKPFKCEICGKSFALKQYLKIHLDYHAGVKPFDCTICSKKFSRKSNLNEHIKSHKRKIKHECPTCGVTFYVLKHFKMHKREHRH